MHFEEQPKYFRLMNSLTGSCKKVRFCENDEMEAKFKSIDQIAKENMKNKGKMYQESPFKKSQKGILVLQERQNYPQPAFYTKYLGV